jgi:hypothetical protein
VSLYDPLSFLGKTYGSKSFAGVLKKMDVLKGEEAKRVATTNYLDDITALEEIVGVVVSDLQPEADASPAFSSTVVLTCSLSVVVITTGARKRPNTAQTALP